jgi:hypothetical protein
VKGITLLFIILTLAVVAWRTLPFDLKWPLKRFVQRHWLVPVILLLAFGGLLSLLSSFSIKLF